MATRSLPDISKATVRRRLKPRSAPYWRKLAKGKAVGVRIGTRGESWLAKIETPAGREQQALPEAQSYDEAERMARVWFDRLAAGVVHGATVEDACRAYVEAVKVEKGESTRAAKDAEARLRKRVYGSTFGAIKLVDLRAADVTAWRDALLETVTRSTANRELAQLKAALSHAHRQQMIDTDRAWSVVPKFPGADTARRLYLSVEQRRAFLAAAEGSIAHLIEAAMHTGGRPIELTRATVADLDVKTGTLSLLSHKGRGGQARRREVPLSPPALAFFKRMKRGKLPSAPLLTRDDGRPWQHSDHDHLVRAARDKAGLPAAATLYSIRHSVVTDLLSAGIDTASVGKIVGTSIEMIDRHYHKLIQANAQRAMAGVVLV